MKVAFFISSSSVGYLVEKKTALCQKYTLPTLPNPAESFLAALSKGPGMHLRTLLRYELLSCETPLHLSTFCLFSTNKQFLSSLSSDGLQGGLFLCFISSLASKAGTDPKGQWTESDQSYKQVFVFITDFTWRI